MTPERNGVLEKKFGPEAKLEAIYKTMNHECKIWCHFNYCFPVIWSRQEA